MIDKNIIRENYAKMEDGLLIKVAREDGHTLTPEAFDILKEEFKKRKLDYSYIVSAEETKILIHQEKIQEIKDGIDNDHFDAVWKYALEEKINGSSQSGIIAGLIERGLDEPRAILLLNDMPVKLNEIIKAYDTKMLLGGISFVIGILVTLLTYFRAINEGGIYIIAWGAIVFGFVRFCIGYEEKRKYKKYLKIAVDNADSNAARKSHFEYRGH
jgi:hypothetical protein